MKSESRNLYVTFGSRREVVYEGCTMRVSEIDGRMNLRGLGTEREWSSSGVLCCELDVGFRTGATLSEGGPLIELCYRWNVGSRRVLPWSTW